MRLSPVLLAPVPLVASPAAAKDPAPHAGLSTCFGFFFQRALAPEIRCTGRAAQVLWHSQPSAPAR